MKPKPLAVAAILLPVAATAWAALLYLCWLVVAGAAAVLDIISRSL